MLISYEMEWSSTVRSESSSEVIYLSCLDGANLWQKVAEVNTVLYQPKPDTEHSLQLMKRV